jgi:hypothetical protein
MKKNVRIILYCLFITMAGSVPVMSQTKVLFLGNSQLGVYDGITGKRVYDLPGMIKVVL